MCSSDLLLIGGGWSTFQVLPSGDMNADGNLDIVALTATGRMYFYAGAGNGRFAAGVQKGLGWTGAVFNGGADLNGDGLRDILGRNPQGLLSLYSGQPGGSFAPGVEVASGW